MTTRYTIRPASKGPMHWFWSIVLALAVIALIGAVSETAAVVVVVVAFLWWLALRAGRAWARTYER